MSTQRAACSRCKPRARSAALVGALLACSAPAVTARPPVSGAPSAAPDAASAGATPQTPSPSAAASAAPLSDLVVGSERGLEIWSTESQLKRLVTAGPALHPRWLDSGALLVLVPATLGTLAHGAEFQRITLADGVRTPLGKLPRFSCTPPGEAPDADADEYHVDVQDESEYELDLVEGAVCLTLQNRNDNMADLALSVRFDLATHQIERWLDFGAESCQPPADVELRIEKDENDEPGERTGWCAHDSVGLRRPPTQPDARPFDFTSEGNLQKRTPKGWKNVLHIADYSPEAASPSGRWLVLGGDQEDADYIHRSLVLLDRDRGLVYPIVTGGWPEPLQPKDKAHPQLATPIQDTIGVVGESELRWIGTPEAEILIVDGSALRPGVGSFEFHGQLAR